jgi:ABC-type polysaccharide/polyol phosphate export permease
VSEIVVGGRASIGYRLKELYRARVLIRSFLLQDFRLKYRRSAMGFLWSFMNPLLMLIVISTAFSFVFPEDGGRYTLHLIATLFPWMTFSQAFEESSRSIVASEAALRQFYFPRLVFPLRRALFRTCEFVMFLAAILVIAYWRGRVPDLSYVVLPYGVLVLFLVSLGLGSVGAVLTVYFRDTEHIISVFLRAWFYLTPIIIPAPRFPTELRALVVLNPFYYVLEMFEAPIAQGHLPSVEAMAIAGALAVGIGITGTLIFFLFEDRLIFRL